MFHCLFYFSNGNKQIKLRLSTHTILLALPNSIGYHTYYSMDDFDVLINVIPLDGEGNYPFYTNARYKEIKCTEKLKFNLEIVIIYIYHITYAIIAFGPSFINYYKSISIP
jgi:hypothetical protein